MSFLIKVNVIEAEDADSFDLFFWGDSLTDALDLAASLCDHDKLSMLGYKIVTETESIPKPVLSLGSGGAADVYQAFEARFQTGGSVH